MDIAKISFVLHTGIFIEKFKAELPGKYGYYSKKNCHP